MRYSLVGLDCPNCAAKLERELRKVNGLENITINFNTLSVELPEIFAEEACAVIKRVEPEVKLQKAERSQSSSSAEEAEEHNSLWIIIGAGLLFAIGLIFNQSLHNTPFSWAEYAVLIPAYLLVGWPVILAAFRKAVGGELFDENFLMTISTGGAIAIYQLPEAVGVMLFYAVGEYLQDRAVDHSRQSITALLNTQPEYANLKENGGIRQVRPEEIEIGQIIIIKPGEKVPLDGQIIDGTSFVDTSALTGESVPRKVEIGGNILSGMINGQGLLTVMVSKPFKESSVARILELVEKASERKAPTEQFITKFANFYTPIVVGAAALIAIIPPLLVPGAAFSEWIYRALVLLVISCPCALMVSIPLGYFGGIGAASKNGILVKGANYIDALAELDTVVFDKTGTLTKGVFRVTQIVSKNHITPEEILSAAAGAEIYSNHPIAQSIFAAYKEKTGKEITDDQVKDYREIAAHGISACVNGNWVLAGNDRLMHKENIIHEDCDVAGTIVYVAIDGVYAGYIVISDELKPDAKEAISRLKQLGIRKTVMLSGDDKTVAEKVSQEIGIDEYFAELLPEGKVEMVEELEKEIKHREKQKLVFVGDGINDAPVITRADIGVAMGGLGSDAVVEAADVVLMENAPSKLAKAVVIARRTRRIVRQNICMALTVKAFFILLGTIGLASIWEAVFADVGVTFLAVLNASRTLQRRKRSITA
ncbi:MAG TPA: cadmium-translocating P-type ATPase [Desulfotomaculum sp.]|nr:MAG: Heavy metal-(Cd/Co/Hg/Pb/Zn)-translocating P-type ATPase [Desulfotomaculum sp. 46_80]HAG11081.1 cadmium-translocating P-type ATPase [Desulfotomaculum sp.]HBY03605.1 cadmium-translocating P-type ATPase [Desulfotomaculum sp.]